MHLWVGPANERGGWTAGEPDIVFGPENMGIDSEVGEAVSGGRIQTEGPRSFGWRTRTASAETARERSVGSVTVPGIEAPASNFFQDRRCPARHLGFSR